MDFTNISLYLGKHSIEIIDQLCVAMENKKIVCGVFADLSNAFDNVDHNVYSVNKIIII